MFTRNELTQTILKARYNGSDRPLPWRDVALRIYPQLDPNQTGALLYKLIYQPDYHPGADVCQRLDLCEPKLTDPCPACGQVHKIDGVCVAHSIVNITVVEVDAEEYAKIDRPVTITIKRRARKDTRPRATINTANPESAAKTIRRKMDAGTLAALVELLKDES